MASTGTKEDGDIGFQIAPMVDVVFVLLLFFMAAAGSQQISKELSSNLPGKQGASPQALTVIRIDILPDGRVQLNDRVFDTAGSRDLPEMRSWLKDTIAKFGDRDPVVLTPAPSTPHQRVIDVLNAASAAGVTKLTFG
jgi:biopolymer transport protein ExbD